MRITSNVHLVADGMRGLSHELDCCVYLLRCGDQFVMIDSGVGLDNETIVNNMTADGVDLHKVRHLLVTHSHSDHACGAKFFQDSLQAETWAPEREARLIESGTDEELGLDMARPAIYPANFRYSHCKPDRLMRDGEQVRIGGKTLRFIEVPGHSPGITCILVAEDRTLFSTDVVFHGGTIGLGNWAGCELEPYRRSIGKLAGLGVEQMFPGHFMFVLRNGQKHIDQAIANLKSPWVPPAWLHRHPHY